ncbi:hypothetical protein Tco_1232948 [Tanacetum coccineum]
MFKSSSSTPSLPYSRSSRRRSFYVSSSLETSHTSSSPSPLSNSFLPSPSVGPSRKTCRSPTPSLPETVAAVSTPPIEMLPPRKRLDDHNEMIKEMYEHLLDVPSTRPEDTDHELETLRSRVVSSEREIASLHVRAKVVEQRDEIAKDRISKLDDRLRYAQYWIQQGELASVNYRVRIGRIE